jgi:hypothetical protein
MSPCTHSRNLSNNLSRRTSGPGILPTKNYRVRYSIIPAEVRPTEMLYFFPPRNSLALSGCKTIDALGSGRTPPIHEGISEGYPSQLSSTPATLYSPWNPRSVTPPRPEAAGLRPRRNRNDAHQTARSARDRPAHRRHRSVTARGRTPPVRSRASWPCVNLPRPSLGRSCCFYLYDEDPLPDVTLFFVFFSRQHGLKPILLAADHPVLGFA